MKIKFTDILSLALALCLFIVSIVLICIVPKEYIFRAVLSAFISLASIYCFNKYFAENVGEDND